MWAKENPAAVLDMIRKKGKKVGYFMFADRLLFMLIVFCRRGYQTWARYLQGIPQLLLESFSLYLGTSMYYDQTKYAILT